VVSSINSPVSYVIVSPLCVLISSPHCLKVKKISHEFLKNLASYVINLKGL
jgi:hypothetical protein